VVYNMEEKGGRLEGEIVGVEILLEFLRLTADGKYASIEKVSLPYSRVKEETYVSLDDECGQYYYGLS